MENIEINNLNDLENIQLVINQNTKSISISNIKNLTDIKILCYKNTERLYLENLPNVKGEKIHYSAKEIILNNLSFFSINHAYGQPEITCEKLTLKNMNTLYNINLEKFTSIKEVEFQGSFLELRSVNFTGLKNIKITGLDIIEKIEGIDIIGLTPEMRANSISIQPVDDETRGDI